MRKSIISILISILFLSCYDDLGNYEYRPINELMIEGIESFYIKDQFDTLRITPTIKGTIYSDTARFTYYWEIDHKNISNQSSLAYRITNTPGEKYGRFIIEDKRTKIKEYCYFNLGVVSSTAVDGIVLLSHYKGKSELSFKRADRDSASFLVNFFEDLNQSILGVDPKKIVQLFSHSKSDDADLFGLQVLSGKNVKRVSYKTLLSDSVHPNLTPAYFKALLPPSPSYPHFEDYQIQDIYSDQASWMESGFFGVMNRVTTSMFVTNGSYFMLEQAGVIGGVSKFSFLRTSELDGELHSIWTNVSKTKAQLIPGDFVVNLGYILSDYILVYDKTNSCFCYGSDGGNVPFKVIDEFKDINLEGYNPVFASPTRNANNPICILSNGVNYRCITFQAPASENQIFDEEEQTGIPFKIISDVTLPQSNIDQYSDFYCYITDENLYISIGATLYAVNIQGLKDGDWNTKKVIDLSEYGYDYPARINCFDFARSGKHIVVGVAQDGKSKELSSDELTGDVLLLEINKENNEVKLKDKYIGVGGTPVDIIIKYISHFQEGRDLNGTFRDHL